MASDWLTVDLGVVIKVTTSTTCTVYGIKSLEVTVDCNLIFMEIKILKVGKETS